MSNDEFDHIQDKAEREQLAALGVPVKIIYDWQRDLLRSPLVKYENGRKIVDIPRWLGSARSTKVVLRATNAVHPSGLGGYQMGDAIAAMLMTLPEFRVQ